MKRPVYPHRDLINGQRPFQGVKISDEWQQLGQDIDQPRSASPHLEIGGDMALDLWVADTESHQHAESEQLTGAELLTITKLAIPQ